MPERGPFNGQLRRQDPALLFYLDTHWQEDVPRYQELEIIEARWSRSAVVRKAFYRKSDSAEETVAKRGCIVLASPEMALAVDAFSSLRAGELTRQTTLNG
ncbi:hypothetical protein PV963_29730 [Streptomyces coeruleorubidus]|uniref:hypothetical protein n=1 Tax=Streptomyces coeruleorubidus TaxID=116188 RepID=UPI00237FCC4C|nr:hypothetical protein [Streptomyces coeruleorubidus]WDV54242.1 hypothetical protein PV963_29730 [Streptomyces coeruleorubidus]